MRNQIKGYITDFRAKYGKNPKTMWMNMTTYEMLHGLGSIFYKGLDGNSYFRYSDYTVVRICVDFNLEGLQLVLSDAPYS